MCKLGNSKTSHIGATFQNSKYRISSYSFRRNYSFLNLTLCTVTFGTGAETIQGQKLYEEIRYVMIFKTYVALTYNASAYILGTNLCILSL